MKVSEITLGIVAEHCRIIEADLTEIERNSLNAMLRAAISYCVGYTGLTEMQLDEHEDITIAVLTIISDMYDNRQMYVDKSHINRTAETILTMYAVNWIPEEVASNVN